MPAPSHDRPELTEARAAFDAGRFELAIEAAEPHLNSPDAPLRAQASRVAGLAHFQRGEYAAATDLLEAAAKVTDDPDGWFNVATSATMAGDVERGAKAFGRAVEGEGSERLSLPQMHFYYALALKEAGEYERALEPLTWLRSVYADLTITDDTFVYIRGVPFLSHTLDLAVEVFTALARGNEGRAWMNELASEVDAEGRETIARCQGQLP